MENSMSIGHIIYIIFFSESDYLQEPSGFVILNVSMKEITFIWTASNFICPESTSYIIISNCSVISCITTRNKAICSNLLIPSVCTFSIHNVVCGQIGPVTNTITVTLKRMLHIHTYIIVLV